MTPPIPNTWQKLLASETDKPYFKELQTFLRAERTRYTVYPPEKDVFAALELTSYETVRVLLLGQDPYHGKGQANGLCFSVQPGVTPPPSLRNIFQELHDDLGCPLPDSGDLTPWAQQGVLLLNAVLTVRAHKANSHQGKGWETFTDTIIAALNNRPQRVVFLLWGNYAQRKASLIDKERHVILKAAHPSPFSAQNGFFGSQPFSRANKALADAGLPQIDWCLPAH